MCELLALRNLLAATISSTHGLNNDWLSAVTTVEHSVESLLRFWLFMLLAMLQNLQDLETTGLVCIVVVRSHLILQTH